jgi:hypothetical protein
MPAVERIRRYIAANLTSPELMSDVLCARLQLSRTQLYRLFEPLGGVAGYIQDKGPQPAPRPIGS